MKKQDYTITIEVDAPMQEVFSSINDVTKWWTDDLTGSSQKLNDEFTVQFGDVHKSKQKLIEVIPDKKITAVFGPKGGWDDLELDSAKRAGFTITTFGGRIMRAETAAIAMSAILQHRFGDLS